MDIFNVVTRSHICREFNCHKDTIKRWIKEEGFPELIQPRQNGGQARPDQTISRCMKKRLKVGLLGLSPPLPNVGGKTEYQLNTDAGPFFVTQPSGEKRFPAGAKIYLALKPDTVRLFPPD